MDVTNFKLIAVRPLDGCHEDYRKILEEGRIYYLFRNCTIEDNEELKLSRDFLSPDFFNPSGTLIEVSAIVGKNGSGKSTLVELILMAINNLACERIERDLVFVNNLRVDLYFLSGPFYKLHVDGTHATIFRYSPKSMKMVEDKRFNLRAFFYAIAVNYSQYAYNELDFPRTQRWLTGVFHKNDGYQVPLVLNPFRQDGNMDINREHILARARLIANLLRPATDNFDFRLLTERFRAAYIRLSVNKGKPDGILYTLQEEKKEEEKVRLRDITVDRDKILRLLNSHFHFGYRKALLKENDLAVRYILSKLVTICIKYEEYKQYFLIQEKKFREETLEEFIERIILDSSHIAFKLKQTLNYIRFRHFDPNAERLELDEFGKRVYELMEDQQNRIGELIELLPPPIFRTQLIATNILTGEEVHFRHFSSGEKQWSYATSTFLYHLNNLDSVARSRGKRVFYNRVLIILEEVELYFHPEMQRRYVQYVINSIARLQLKNIDKVHVCFVTHSPMMLSDIPEQNILFLDEKGQPADPEHITQTFGGNIHELLARSFFLNKALIGEFALSKIEWIIRLVRPDTDIKLQPSEQEELFRTIRLVGEDFLREKLLEMYEERYGIPNREAEIKALEERLNQLRNDRS